MEHRIYIMEATGKSKQEARDAILTQLRLKEDDLEFEQIGAKGGLFGFGSKSVTLRAYPRHDDVPQANLAAGIVLTLIQKMGFEGAIEEIVEADGKTHLHVSSPQSGILIGRKGKTLDSLQFLTDVITSRLKGNSERKKIIIDIEGYRDKRRDSLISLAQKLAKRVEEKGKPWLLKPLNPFERRIVHLALQEYEKVYTKSEGTGIYKRVCIDIVPEGRQKAEFLKELERQEAELEDARGNLK